MLEAMLWTLLADHHYQVLPKVWNDCIIVLVLSLCGTRTRHRLGLRAGARVPFYQSTSTILLLAVVGFIREVSAFYRFSDRNRPGLDDS